ncbi:putative receptor like protein 25 [Lycium ferocissimum]|uniref:putative receptor like protein 25 n=1 Tax=Lycium ferocissimum TaxID=112874 RepID=UPI0028165856|nr:putative receptor like protein 25 [Lycium ferocissimum]
MNTFSNGIPREIGGLQNLIHLSLRDNKLQGSIPGSMSSMSALEFLDLSHNNVSGLIPKSLEKLQNLKYFNVSFNKLVGEIPSGGPFKNLSSQSFMSNEALCGSQRFRVLPCHNSTSKHISKRTKVLALIRPDRIALELVSMAFALEWIRVWTEAIGVNKMRNGLERLVSTKCDVYSYGIMLMETFTQTKPSDEMFGGDLSLKQWVSNSLPHSATKVVDANLITPQDNHLKRKLECVASIMKVTMDCCVESPSGRIDMKDVVARLKTIQIQLIAS